VYKIADLIVKLPFGIFSLPLRKHPFVIYKYMINMIKPNENSGETAYNGFIIIFIHFPYSARNWRDTIGKSVGKSPNFRTRPTLRIHQPRLTRCLATMRSRCELARPPSSAPHRMLSDLVYQCTIHGQKRYSNGTPMDKLGGLCFGYQLRSVGWLKANSTGNPFFP